MQKTKYYVSTKYTVEDNINEKYGQAMLLPNSTLSDAVETMNQVEDTLLVCLSSNPLENLEPLDRGNDNNSLRDL
jgi:hypothetical protein